MLNYLINFQRLKLYEELKARKLTMGEANLNIPEIFDAEIKLDSEGELHFPVLLFYDEYMQCDVIQVK